MNMKDTIELEKRIATAVVDAALKAGYVLAIDNHGDGYEYKGTHRKTILDSMQLTDDEWLYLFKPGAKRPFAWVYFVYGNDGWDVINDYTTNLDKLGIMKDAEKISEQYQ